MPDDVLEKAPHTPADLFRADAIYMITGAIYQRQHLMRSSARKTQWRAAFVKASALYGWGIVAWAVMNNHYHLPNIDEVSNVPVF